MPISKYQKAKLKKRNNEMLQLHKTGMSTYKLAALYGLTPQGIAYAIKQAEKDEQQELSTA